ncbi:MAG: PIG-L deacetylase family protein [Acidimicrobiia bacterium]
MPRSHDERETQPAPLGVPARVLAIGAHPDDIEFGCGATLARWSDAGSTIALCIVTDGSKGSWNPSEDQLALITRRHVEQDRAGGVLGVSAITYLDHVDGELEYTMELRREIAMIIRRDQPDVVLTHDPWQKYQIHPDHRVTGLSVVDAVVAAREPLSYIDSDLDHHRPAHILLWSAEDPDHLEPITPGSSERKAEALLCHVSQGHTTMGDPHSGPEELTRFVASLDDKHRAAGTRFGAGPAEVFKLLTP